MGYYIAFISASFYLSGCRFVEFGAESFINRHVALDIDFVVSGALDVLAV